MNFGHLHIHNEFSYLDGFGSAENYAKEAKKAGFNFLALTNHGNLDGLIKFQKACDKEGVHPILGCEAYIVPDILRKEKGEKRGHVTLLVKNETGWQNLCRLMTKANMEGFYYKPRIDFNLLLNHCDGLVVLTGCGSSFLLLPGGAELFHSLIEKIGDDIYLEIMPHNMQEQIDINQICVDMNKSSGVPLVATNDCHYISADDETTQEVLLAIQTKAKWEDVNRWKFEIKGLYLRTANEMRKAFVAQDFFTDQEIEDALAITEEISQKCQFKIPKQDISLPKVPGYEDEDPGKFIWEIAEKKLLDISKDWDTKKVNQYFDRLSEEWKLINDKGFAPYFMIVWELINWCKTNKIMVGPGRGSVGGSLLAYLMGITAVDPIKYNLLFSRFIAEDRIDYPDIDMDFEDWKRPLVREHLKELYGKNHVAAISTFMTMKGRGSIRDVCRVFDVPLADVDAFAKSVSDHYDTDENMIEEALKTKEGKKFQEKYGDLIHHITAIEGQVRGVGKHAAAMIVSMEDLTKGTRGNLASRGDEVVCNWDMKDSEYVGLMKLDVLGLNTLSILNETKRLIEERPDFWEGEFNHLIGQDGFDFEKIPLDDPVVYADIYDGNTIGIFQLSAWATTQLARQIKATNINELSDIIALVRPGPLDSGMTDQYIEHKNKGGKWKGKGKEYDQITKDTYGIIIYQEQIMEVINKVAGLSYVTADKIRKVISKKRDANEFKPYEEAFVSGCLEKKTFSEKQAREFWQALQKHARYSFNKSHSVEYAIVGYWTAWCKQYFPVEFMCAALTYGQENKKEEMVQEAYRMGLEVVLPKIGESDSIRWIAKGGKLHTPFIEIKGVGEKMAIKCVEMGTPISKPSIVSKIKPKLKGFFSTSIPNIRQPQMEAIEVGMTKLESILHNIGAFGETPADGIQDYFSFPIVNSYQNNNLKSFLGNLAEKRGISALDIDEVVARTIKKHSLIKEVSFSPKISFSRCHLCGLRDECTAPVSCSPGYFNIAIVGEAPGREEDQYQKGFIGPSGKMIWSELAKYSLNREDFHVTNVNKCFPSISKTPSPEQIKICSQNWLFEEFKEIDCRLILAFGNTALRALADRSAGIRDLSGTTEWNDKIGAWICWAIHPSAVLRDGKNKPIFEFAIKNFVSKIELMSTSE